jgi:hypothetical protein|tara:strand:+ start:1794 stop:2126 length:333 start_codon:yes stop_codon:yes gene_type:complete
MRNAYVVIKDMIDLIPQSEEERFQILKHNLSTHILGSWAHAAPEKQYSQWPWSTAKYYLELTKITDDDFNNKDWLQQFHSIYVNPNYKIELSHYNTFIKTEETSNDAINI